MRKTVPETKALALVTVAAVTTGMASRIYSGTPVAGQKVYMASLQDVQTVYEYKGDPNDYKLREIASGQECTLHYSDSRTDSKSVSASLPLHTPIQHWWIMRTNVHTTKVPRKGHVWLFWTLPMSYEIEHLEALKQGKYP